MRLSLELAELTAKVFGESRPPTRAPVAAPEPRPPVTPPSGGGYGTRLIEHAIAYSLNGRLDRTYAPEGLKARIAIPV